MLLNVNKLIKLNSACISLEKWQRNNTKSLTHIMMQAFAPSQGNLLSELLKEVETYLNGCLTPQLRQGPQASEQKEKKKLMLVEKPKLTPVFLSRSFSAKTCLAWSCH